MVPLKKYLAGCAGRAELAWRHVTMGRLILSYAADERGATAIEYGLIVSLISVTILGTLVILGANLRDKAMVIADAIAEAGR
jgi:Flp pilus assembly pilin Flp